MEIDMVALRKLIAGIIAIAIASGLIKNKFIATHKSARVLLYVLGIALIAFALLYQFDIIPDQHSDVIFKTTSENSNQ